MRWEIGQAVTDGTRRGTVRHVYSSGQCLVDGEGMDGRRYRARWPSDDWWLGLRLWDATEWDSLGLTGPGSCSLAKTLLDRRAMRAASNAEADREGGER